MEAKARSLALMEYFLEKAAQAGCPLDQMKNFVRGGYVPQPKQSIFHAICRDADQPGGPVEVAFGGARGPGKSHAMMAQITLDDCQRFPGLKCLMLRRVGRAVRESFEDLRVKVLPHVPHMMNRTSGTLSFPNGSRVILGHFLNEKDIDNYLGLEYDLIGVEEGTTLSSSKYRAIRTCCRSSKHGWRPRTYSNANPGGVGHAWYKARFIIPWRNNAETTTRFIPATYRDNVFLGEEYVEVLDSLVGWQKRAWKDGDWDIAAGQFFTTFDHDVHVIDPIPVEEWWPTVWLAFDYGWTHPTFVILFARDLTENIYVVDEYSAAKRYPAAHGAMIRQMLARWKIREERVTQFLFGRDAYAKDKEGRTVVDSYMEDGWYPTPANMARVQGAVEVLRRLGDKPAGIVPTMYIYRNCVRLIETLPRMEHDPHRPEDVLKVHTDEEGIGGDDAYDCLRYGLMGVAATEGPFFESLEVPR